MSEDKATATAAPAETPAEETAAQAPVAPVSYTHLRAHET